MKKQPGPITQILTRGTTADMRDYTPVALRQLREGNNSSAIRIACAVLGQHINNPEAWNIIFCACIGRKQSFVKALLGSINARFAFPKHKVQNIPSWMADHGHIALAWEKLLEFFREREDIVMIESVLKILVHVKKGSSSLVNLAEFLVGKTELLSEVSEKATTFANAIALLQKAEKISPGDAEIKKRITDAMARAAAVPWQEVEDFEGSYLKLIVG